MLLCALLLVCSFRTASAASVELRLVPFDKPDLTVDKLEKERPITNPVTTTHGMEMQKIGVDYTGWARNIFLDGKPVFERYYQGKYIDRLPVARPDLSPGDHTIWPGNHVFTVAADGSITSKSPELIISAGIVKIKCYPVTLRAYIANPDEAELPLSMRITPLPNLTLRDAANAEENAPNRSGGQDNALELLPVFDKFAPLTLWLPANTEGKGYLVHPVGLTFQLSAAGISAGAGGGQTVKGLHVEQNIIEIPLFSYPITGDGNTKAVITGMEQLTWPESENGETKSLVLYPRRDPFEFLITKPGPSLMLDSDTLPFKSLRVDIPDPATGNQRAIAVEMASRHFEPGGTADARVRALDAMPAQTANHAAAMAHTAVAFSARALQAAQAGLTQAEQAAKAAQEKEAAAAFAVEPVRLKGTADAAKLAAAKQRVADATQAVDAAKKSVADATLAGDQAKKELLEVTDSAANAKKETTDAAAKVVTLADEAVVAAKQKSAAAAKAAKPLQNAMKAATAALNSATADLAKTESDIATAPAPTDPVGADLDEAKSELESAKAATVETVKALEAAKVALATAEQSAQTAAVAEDAAAKQIDANSALNPLEKAPPYAQLMPYEGKDWQDLKAQAGADGNVTITLPAVSTGLYRLRLGVHEGNGRPLFADQWISIAAPQPVGVGLFTQRGRNAFFRGEPFWVGLSVLAKEPLPAGEALEVDLVDDHGVRLPMLRDKAPLITKQGTFIIRLDGAQTLSLAAGHYHVEAKVGSQAAAPLALEMIEPEPRTHFTNLLNGKYNVIGGGKGELSYMKAIKTGQGSEQLASEITGMGYNAFMGMCYDMSRVHRSGLDLEQVVRECPELGPWESYYQPSGRDRFLNAAVRQNLRFYEDLFTEHDAMLPRDPQILDACERYSSLETASMHFSPAFRGVCLYDELYDTGDNDAPRSVVAAFFQGQEMSYRAKYPGMTSADAAKALDRFAGRPFGERKYEDLAKFRTWAAHQDSDWQVFSERMAGAVKAVDPGSQNWTLYRAGGNNGGNLSGNGVPENVFSSLDVASTVMYKDGGSGDRPVFAPMMANILHLRDGLPVWTQIHNYHASGLYGSHLFRQAVFGLSQKIDGLTYFTIEHDPYAPDPLDNRDTVRNIAGGLLTPYGDFLSSLDRGYHKVAVFYSREAAQLGVRKVNKLNYTAEGLWVSCLRAGFPADFLYDRQLREGKGMDYDVIFAPGYAYEDEASPEILAALKRLVAAGKTVVVEKSSKLPIEGIVRLDSELDEFDDKLGGAFPRYIDFESEMVWDQTEQTTKLVRGFLSKITKPAAEHNLIVGPDWLKRGQGEYMVLADFAPVKFSGLYKTLYQAPDQPTLRFPRRPPACYDVLEMRPVDVKTDGDWMTLQADMRQLPGKIFAFLPSAIDKVSLKAAAMLPAGTDLNFQASVVNAAGETIDASFPVEITLLDPSGKTCLQIFRAAAPLFQSAWRVPLNASPGHWKLRVRELISGAVTEAGVDVTAPATLSLDAKLDTSPVWVHDGQRIKEFLAGAIETSISAKADAAVHPPEILIALDEEQPWCRPQAEKLAAALIARGRAAKVVNVSDVLRIPNDWGQTPVLDGGRLWRGELVDPGLAVDAPLILLGHRYENRLIEALARRDVLPEVISTHFPAPGKAVVGWTRRAFSNSYDTVSVLSNDDAGLAAGIAEMLHVAGSAPLPVTVQSAFQAGAVLTPASASSNAPTSLRDTLSGEDRIRTLDVDPATGRILAGTFGFGHNLFCFGPDGKLLWKQFLPEHNVYFAHWCNGGKSVVAATGQGFYLFLLNGTDGTVFKKLAATEWPLYHVTYGQGLEGAVNTELQIAVNEPLHEIIVRGQTGLMALDFEGHKLWFHDRATAIAAYPKEAEQSVAATFGQTVHVGNFALSPDGTRVVYSEEMIAGSTPGVKPGAVDSLFKHTPEILDARTGRVLLRNEEDPGNQREAGNWSVSWPPGSMTPRVQTMGLSAPLRDDNTLGPYTPDVGLTLKDGSTLKATRTALTRIAADGRTLWQAGGDTIWLSALDTMNTGQTRFFRCDREGLVRCFEVATGSVLWDFKLPFNAVLHAVGDELVAGANNGALVRLDATGKPVWQTRLRDHHEVPGGDYGAYVAAARLRDVDSTPEFFPSGIDGPDDYKGILRMGIEQLANGDFESPQDWTIEKGTVRVGAPAKMGKSALQLDAGQLATQRLVNRVIPSATYLLEFWYRVEDTKTKLVAGGMLDGTKQTLTASTFSGRPGEWTFGRVAVKSYADTRTLDIGFEADGGHASVDAASLRAVRFPSANLLANTELNAVDPTYVKDIRVQFDRIPSQLRDRLMSRNRVSAFAQGLTAMSMIYTQEAAFLQNGKLDDVGSTWTYAPDPIAFAVTLTKPSYISHLVLYLNNATPDSVYQTISILANNLETKTPQDAALVRMNRRRFVVVNFNPPIFTDSLKIIPAYYRAHTDSLTEIELYGPLDGGKIAGKSGQDSDAVPMLMGTPSRVPARLPTDLVGAWHEFPGLPHNLPPTFASGATVVDGMFSYGDPNGAIRSVFVPDTLTGNAKIDRMQLGPQWTLATVTPTSTPARYKARLLVGSADFKLHAVADNGNYLWSFATGGRVYSSPVPDGDDVFFGSDDGHLYKVDVDSGVLIWEFITGDKIRGSPALSSGRVFVASWDGFLYAVESDSGRLAWKMPIAKFTRATPAVQGNKVFIGDEGGVMHCFDMATGRELWQQQLGGYISACPVVTPEGVAFASEQGAMALMSPDGTVKWKHSPGAGISGQPIATQTQLLVPTEKGLLVLRRADGEPDDRFTGPESVNKVLNVLKWRDQLFVQTAYGRTEFNYPPRTYAEFENHAVVWLPGPEKPKEVK